MRVAVTISKAHSVEKYAVNQNLASLRRDACERGGARARAFPVAPPGVARKLGHIGNGVPRPGSALGRAGMNGDITS